ncbi:MAG TPA: hypothetical protein VIF82_10615 [Burkholderiaceae bacterium]|jgi:intein/homing endonuclease
MNNDKEQYEELKGDIFKILQRFPNNANEIKDEELNDLWILISKLRHMEFFQGC